jgi:mono/diheme cytochrome c family protein
MQMNLSMKAVPRCLLALTAVAGLMSSAPAQVVSDDQATAGRKLAERVCSACHVVTGQGGEAPLLTSPGPSFAVLARRPAWTEQSLREFLGQSQHYLGPVGAMPNPRLADYQIDEIVAYFMTLKPPGSFKFSDPGK